MSTHRILSNLPNVPDLSDLSISVVVCAYTEERWDDLLAAVASLQRQTFTPCEIIVVIDHNSALLQRVTRELPDILVTPNREKRGLCGARNTGIAQAGGEIVAFMDEDAVAAPDWLAQLATHYSDPNVLGVGGAIVPNWQRERPTWFPPEFDWVVGCTYQGMPTTPSPVRNLIGCNMSFRRELFVTVGGFRTDIGQVGTSMLRCDETEMCIRIRQKKPNGVLCYDPSALVYHNVPTNRACWDYFRLRCYTEGQAKAVIAQIAGSQSGLSSERAYTMKSLPQGILRESLTALRQGEPSGFMRAGAIVAGLVITVAGYGVGWLTQVGRV